MPHHPSLKEVLDQDNPPLEEWSEFTIDGFGWGVWVSAERVIGEQPEPEYNFACSPLRSEFGEHGRFSSPDNVFLFFEMTTAENLKNLEGDPNPLGSLSLFESTIVTLRVTPEVYNELISLLHSGLGKITVRISIPKWEDKDCKCLPISQYQVMFNNQG